MIDGIYELRSDKERKVERKQMEKEWNEIAGEWKKRAAE
jgi:hypothetical protein